MDEQIRLSKLMSLRGLASRREADRFIEAGLVLVDGQPAGELGCKVDPDAKIELQDAAQKEQEEKVTIVLHKPLGYVSSQPEEGYLPAISLITPKSQFRAQATQPLQSFHKEKLAVAGRLDINSTGLLVLTQDGRVAKKLIGEDSAVEKEYLVRVEGVVDEQALQLLRCGLMLDGRRLRPADISQLRPQLLRFVLRQGRKRQIRRMCEQVGLEVVQLKRVRIGNLCLGNLPKGRWRFASASEF